MKKSITIIILVIACAGIKLIAQNKETTSRFGPLNTNPLRYRFDVHLEYSNQLTIELTSMKLLPLVMNIDSILAKAVKQLPQLLDSLQPYTDSKKVEFVTGPAGLRQMRVTNTAKDRTFAIQDSGIAILKIDQDTLVLSRLYQPVGGHIPANSFEEWRITLLINDFDDLGLLSSGKPGAAVKEIAASYVKSSGWTEKNDAKTRIAAAYFLSDTGFSSQPVYKGRSFGYNIGLIGEAGVQNVGNLLTPSVVSPDLQLIFRRNGWTKVLKLDYEVMFFLDRDTKGKASIYPNTFINIGFTRKPADGHTLPYWQNLFNSISIGALIYRHAEYFDKNTFRLGLGGFTYKTLSLRPQFFFHDLFKDISPSVRVGILF